MSEYRVMTRDVAGHFIDADRCNFFMHKDIVAKGNDAFQSARFCVSLIGEYQMGMLNASGLKYELAVFDKESESPWLEIDGYRTDDKEEAIKIFNNKVKEYLKKAKG